MDFAQQQRNPSKHLAGIAFVILLHVLLVYALVTGLARKVVEVVKAPLETKLIEEIKKQPPPDTPPPPPPKLAPPPPPFIPPPEVNIAVTPPPNAIAAVTNTPPPEPVPFTPTPAAPAPVADAPKAPVRTAPVIDAKRSCSTPEYPPSSRRNEEQGTVVLKFLIDVDGKVIESKVEGSSGFERLDEAAREALSRCRFKPGTTDGKPEQSWASLKYTWKLR